MPELRLLPLVDASGTPTEGADGKKDPAEAGSLLLRVLGLAFGGRRAARGLKKATLPLPGRWLTSE